MKYTYSELLEIVENQLSKGRFRHTLGVVKAAGELSVRYVPDLDLEKVSLAALLHDYAKEIKPAELLSLAEQYKLNITAIEYVSPALLHAKLGRYYAEHDFGVSDPEILMAIESHTLGRPGMSILEKIIFLADCIEENRPEPYAAPIREILSSESPQLSDLDRAIVTCCAQSMTEVLYHKLPLHPLTLETYNFYGITLA